MCVCVMNIKNFCIYFTGLLRDFGLLRERKTSLFHQNLFRVLHLQTASKSFSVCLEIIL